LFGGRDEAHSLKFAICILSTMRLKFCAVLALALCFVLKISAAETLPLAGEWRFALDRHDAGISEHWFEQILPDHIKLPGVLESQGYGDPISIRTPWVLSLYDHFWFLRADYAAYTNADNVKVPFLSQPPRHYLGAAWYQRDVKIPDTWSGKRMLLFLERPHWKSTVWLDDKQIGSDISLCTPHEFDLGILPPGLHRLSIRVDNRMILPYRPDAHSVSDSLDDAWNGIVGKIELHATPLVWVENLQAYPDLKSKSVLLRGHVGNAGDHTVTNLLWLGLAANHDSVRFVPTMNLTLVVPPGGTDFEGRISREIPIEDWDEFHPALYFVGASIGGTNQPHNSDLEITIGFRDFRAEGNQFLLNGHPIYLRGTHFGGDFPLTGYPATDVKSWKKLFRTCKEYGLNHMRFHSWCPPEAAFEAADELGFYLQVECGMWNEFTPGGEMEKMLYAETDRILRDFGNHPSLMLVSASNEAHGRWQQVLPKWVEHYRAADPRRLYTPDTGWVAIDSPGPVSGADYLVAGRIGIDRTRGESGWFGRDYRNSLVGVNVPVISHELGQWCAYPDFRIIKKFTGFMQPGNFEIFRDSAEAHGVLPQNKQFAWASGRFQLECYKEEIEANLRTPGMAGFQLLDLHDYTGQGTALVGLLDPFWQSKGYTTPEEFRKFCNQVVPLARLKQRVFTTADKFDVPLEVANFSAGPLTNALVTWAIRDSNGKIVQQGTNASEDIPLAKGFFLGNISADLSRLAAPAQYKLEVTIVQPPRRFFRWHAQFKNDWNFWLYPSAISNVTTANVLVTSSWSDAEKRLAAGGKVFFLPHNADLDWSSPPLARVPVFWNALMGPTWSRMLGLWCDTKHPALAEFPTDANCDWQWTELLRNTRAINLDHLPNTLQPIVSAIDDWNRNYKLGLIFEARVGTGRLLVCSADLNANTSPVAKQLRKSLLDYMSSRTFQPKTQISMEDFLSLHFNSRIMNALGATARADGRPANEIVDGDPNTNWSSADARGNGAKPPHQIQVSFPQPVAMAGVILMPRQNQRKHQGDIHDYKLECSDDGKAWRQVAAGQLVSTFDEQAIRFGKIVITRNLRLTALSGFGNDKSASLAELAVMYAGPKLPSENSGDLEYRNIRTASPDIDAGEASPNPPK